MHYEYNLTKNDFSLRRIRFEFCAHEPQRFPRGKAGNVFRGSLGWALREISPEGYAEYFEPRGMGGAGPSGFANPPRLYVLRAGHLDGQTVLAGQPFQVHLHLFRNAPEDLFIAAMGRIPVGDLRAVSVDSLVIPLDNRHANVGRLTVRFLTATELKVGGGITEVPDFATVFLRSRDRVRALSEPGLNLDFSGMTKRAQNISLVSHKVIHRPARRTSRKTGQTHPLGGFVGEATYSGNLDEFIPLLEAAQWTGIGRQTVWGKGAIEIAYD